MKLAQLMERADAIRAAPHVPITEEDRFEFAAALILQGYRITQAADIATDLAETDGALQMLARCRVAYSGEAGR